MRTPIRPPSSRRASSRRTVAGALTVITALALTAGGSASADPGDDPPLGDDTAIDSATSESVTLLTGDRVTFDPQDPMVAPTVIPGEGRDHVTFSTRSYDGHIYVVPSDAVELVERGSLDRRLFDVTGLVESGYGDADRDDLPLLVQGTDLSGVEAAQPIDEIDMASVTWSKTADDESWRSITDGGEVRTFDDGISRVWLDGKRELSLEQSVPQIGAPEAWESGYDGEGVTVAVLDTGIDAGHPDLADRILDTKDFTGTGDGDDVGHGTHVASTIAGTGAASDGAYVGVAPEAELLIGKVCATDSCYDSDILAGMQWAAENDATVVNMSLGGTDGPEVDPLEQAVNDLSDQYGTLFVIASGNYGDRGIKVASPAAADAALAVGSVDKQDWLAFTSQRGPRVGDFAVKPDITAPGVNIVAARAEGTDPFSPVGEHYASLSGTSMATPHVAGTAALLAQRHPDWTGEQLKSTLMGSAVPHEQLSPFDQGAGRVDAAHAVTQSVYTSPASVSFGQVQWPQAETDPLTETVTYHNTGDVDLTLDLSIDEHGSFDNYGQQIPDGMFTLSQTAVTVPAGGQASVDFTVDASVEAPAGGYSAYIVATSGDTTSVTPVGYDKEQESYDLAVEIPDREGNPTEQASLLLTPINGGPSRTYYVADGEATLRVPAGLYNMDALVLLPDGDTAVIVDPALEVSEAATLVVDVGEAGPIDFQVPDRKVTPVVTSLTYARHSNGGPPVFSNVTSGVGGTLYIGGLGDPIADDRMPVLVSAVYAKADDGRFAGSPVAYYMSSEASGQIPNGYSQRLRRSDFSKIKADYHTPVMSDIATKGWQISHPSGSIGWRWDMPIDVPIDRTEYVAGPDDTTFQARYHELDSESPDQAFYLQQGWVPAKAYQPGRTYTETWNAAVIGPAMVDMEWRTQRNGDVMVVNVPMFSDAPDARHAITAYDTASTALYADGELVGESPQEGGGVYTVPADETEYVLESQVTRDTYAGLSTEVSASWEFSSAHADQTQPLPLMAVRFEPWGLDEHNRVHGGLPTIIPTTVWNWSGPIKPKDLTIEASYDDGRSWHPGIDVGGLAIVYTPHDAEYVSLRATATDADGNRVTQEIIHAYAVK